VTFACGFQIPVGIDHAGSLIEDRLDLRGHRRAPRWIRPIDFRDQGLQDRRAWRQFRHLNGRAKLLRDRNQPLAHASS
jgi:hypothetical protein